MKSTQYGRTIATAVAGIFALSMSAANAREVVMQQPAYTGSAPEAAASADAKRASVANKAMLINQLANRFQGEAASQYKGNFDAIEWKYSFGSRLFHQSEEALTAGLAAQDIHAMNIKMATASMTKHSGGLSNTINLLANPCRIVDTRSGGGGMLGPVSRFWYVFDGTAATIAAQGGNAAGCGQYPNAEFFLVYVTAVPPGAPLSGGAGFLTLQHDSGVPTTSTMNFYPGINIADFAAVSCFNCGGTSTGGFNAFASANTHVVIDLIGTGNPTAVTYWASVDSAGVIDRCFGCTGTGTSKLGTGVYEIGFTRDITSCGYNGTTGAPTTSVQTGFTSIAQRAGNVNGLFIETFSPAGALADRGYYVSVYCP